jgi:hypothetical protein
MIDIILTVFNNYNLLEYQFKIFKKITGDFKLLICDNTPIEFKKEIYIPETLVEKSKIYNYINYGIDGEKHGDVLDYMVKQTTSDIICIMDLDFFWLDFDILNYINIFFENGYKCVGTELYYNGYDYVNELYPERNSILCPCIFGMFIYKNLIKYSFVSNQYDANILKKETGWKIREYLINNNFKLKTFDCIKHPIIQSNNNIKNIDLPWFYVGNHKIIGVHLVGSTSYNKNNNEIIKYIFDYFNIT